MSTIPSGAVKFSDLQTILGGTNPISMSEYFADSGNGYSTGVSGIPNKFSAINMSVFRGKTKITGPLYTFGSHTFTNAGATGRNGPTLEQCVSAYSFRSWASNTSYFNVTTLGVQGWTVPMTATYTIRAAGSRGSGNGAGAGIVVECSVSLTKGEILNIVCGQYTESTKFGGSGGGGGSFVWRNDTGSLLIAAGGGGGTSLTTVGNGVSGTTAGNGGTYSTYPGGGTGGTGPNGGSGGSSSANYTAGGNGSGGTGGNGGNVASGTPAGSGGGGGGFSSSGTFLGGAKGTGSSPTDSANYGSDGGFGGGGGGGGVYGIVPGGGGGGGYGGGGGGGVAASGGGGSSYGISTLTNIGSNASSGYVLITVN